MEHWVREGEVIRMEARLPPRRKAVLFRDKYLVLVICLFLLFGAGFTELL